jgi:hypothetical protein
LIKQNRARLFKLMEFQGMHRHDVLINF